MNERKNIWLGLVGLAFTLAAWLGAALLMAVGVYTEMYVPGGMDGLSDYSPIAMAGGLILVVSVLLTLVGLVIAIVSFFRPTQNRLFPIFAVILGVAYYVLLGALIFIGLYFPDLE